MKKIILALLVLGTIAVAGTMIVPAQNQVSKAKAVLITIFEAEVSSKGGVKKYTPIRQLDFKGCEDTNVSETTKKYNKVIEKMNFSIKTAKVKTAFIASLRNIDVSCTQYNTEITARNTIKISKLEKKYSSLDNRVSLLEQKCSNGTCSTKKRVVKKKYHSKKRVVCKRHRSKKRVAPVVAPVENWCETHRTAQLISPEKWYRNGCGVRTVGNGNGNVTTNRGNTERGGSPANPDEGSTSTSGNTNGSTNSGRSSGAGGTAANAG